MKLIATAAFGIEASVKREVNALGFTDVVCVDNRVEFSPARGESLGAAIVRANLWLRCADRVLLMMDCFKAVSFEELFEKTRALPWGDWIPQDGKFTVTGKSVKSALFSVPDVQSIVKKAVVEKLKAKYAVSWFEETGAEYTIQAAILKDIVTITIDTTGAGNALHKRGYRERSNAAPMKETMAAALIELSRYHGKQVFLDPCCGSGTLPIEAAMIARNIAPGLSRKFACEGWAQIDKAEWREARAAAYAAIKQSAMPPIFAADIDAEMVDLARANAELAGVDDCITFEARAVAATILPAETGIAVVNPPYGERLGKIREAEALYAELGRVFAKSKWKVSVITPDEFFESAYTKKANAKRKLFNAMIKVELYQYF